MQQEINKEFSAIVSLDRISTINGDLSRLNSSEARQSFVENFFHEKYGDGGGALSVFEDGGQVRLRWQQRKVDSSAEKAHFEALKQAKGKNYAEAIGNWVKAISLNPSDPDYYFNLGIAFFELKNYKESVENLRSALNLCPIYFKAQLILGTAYLKMRKYDPAEEHLRESMIFYPNHPLVYLNLGAVYSIQRKYDDAVKMFLRTIELAPDEVRAHFGLGKIYALKRDFEKATSYYSNVVEINKNPELTRHAKRAMAVTPQTSGDTATPIALEGVPVAKADAKQVEKYYQEGFRAYLFTDYERAIQMYRTYLHHRPKDDFVWFSLGEAEMRAGNVPAAAAAFYEAIKHNPGKSLYYKELAVSSNYLDKKEEALQCLEKAEQLGKVDSIICTIWGKILIEQNKIPEALKRLEKAVQLNSNNLLARYNLAIAAIKDNQQDLASNILHEIVRAPVDSPIKTEAKSLINDLFA